MIVKEQSLGSETILCFRHVYQIRLKLLIMMVIFRQLNYEQQHQHHLSVVIKIFDSQISRKHVIKIGIFGSQISRKTWSLKLGVLFIKFNG